MIIGGLEEEAARILVLNYMSLIMPLLYIPYPRRCQSGTVRPTLKLLLIINIWSSVKVGLIYLF